MELLSSPFEPHFQRLLETGATRLLICAPYFSRGPVSALLRQATAPGSAGLRELKVITDLSARNILSGSTDIEALVELSQAVAHTEIVYVPRVHAKVYVAGDSLAVIASANFTESGAKGNLEYGVAVSEAPAIRRVTADLERYAALGGLVSAAGLAKLASRARELRAAMEAAQASANAELRRAAAHLQRETEDDLIRLHVAGRSPYAIFAQTVLYLLSSGPMTTATLNEHVRLLHPDLCDDATDRVIDGHRFGKLWKHQVRTAQQHLKRRGLVRHDGMLRRWEMA